MISGIQVRPAIAVIRSGGPASASPSYRLVVCAWFALCIVSYAHYRLLTGIHENTFVGLLGFAACYYLWLPLTPLIFRLEQRWPATRPFSIGRLLGLLSMGLPICYISSLIAVNTRPTLDSLLPDMPVRAPFTYHIGVAEANLQASLYLVLLGISAFLRYVTEMRAKEHQAAALALEKAELQGALREAELETLRMRLNPHFLFNCLQNVASLAEESPVAAAAMLARLGDLLRVALSENYRSQIALSQEIELTRAYLAIEQVRFGNRLSVEYSLDPLTDKLQVPSLLLQPLVENALRHGFSRQGQGKVSIASSIEAGMLILTVCDTGIGLPETQQEASGFGVGLTATSERLKRLYGARQSLSISNTPGGGVEVKVTLPATPTADLVQTRAACAPIHLDVRASVVVA